MSDKSTTLSLIRIERESATVEELAEALEKPEADRDAPTRTGFWTRQFPASGKGWGTT